MKRMFSTRPSKENPAIQKSANPNSDNLSENSPAQG
jgi:hypothetical protein